MSGDGAGSSIALARRGHRRLALVADADGHAVRMLDTRTGEELPQTDLPGEPSQVLVAPDGRVFVSVRDSAQVDVLEQIPGERPALRVAGQVKTAEEPTGLALTPDGRTLLVTCGWAHMLDAFATRTLERAFQVDVAREPRAVVTSADGRLAYVSHATRVGGERGRPDVAHPRDPRRAHGADRTSTARRPSSRGARASPSRAPSSASSRPGVEANTGDTTVRTETYGGTERLLGARRRSSTSPSSTTAARRADRGAKAAAVDAAPRMNGRLHPVPAAPRGRLRRRGRLAPRRVRGAGHRVAHSTRARGMGARPATWKVGGEPTGLAIDGERRARASRGRRRRAR